MSQELALHGGKRTVPEGFVQSWPHVTEADQEAVMDVFKSTRITEQQRIQQEGLTKEWAEYMGVKYCIPVNSGTAALHLCVAAVGIEPGDEVIVPAFTFWASAAAALHHNAIPVFVDIHPKTYCIDPDSNRSQDNGKNKSGHARAYSRHACGHGCRACDSREA